MKVLAVARVGRRLGVGEDVLRLWKQAFSERGTEALPGHGRLTPADEEPRRLRAEVNRRKAERDLQKSRRPQPAELTFRFIAD